MMALLAALFSAANAPYTAALLVVALYVGLQLFGLFESGDHPDGDLGAEHSVAAGGHAAADAAGGDLDGDGEGADPEAGSEPDPDHGSDAGEHAEPGEGHASIGGLAWALSALGVGRVPLAIVWQTFFTMFGLIGITATTVTSSLLGSPRPFFLAISFPLALVLGALLTAGTARGIARLVPSSSGDATRKRDLVGCSGVVISTKVDAEFGEVRLRDPQGRTLRLICHALPGEPALPEGTEVVVVDYERSKGHLFVSRLTALPEGHR